MAQQSIREHAEEFVRLGTEYFRLARIEAAYRQLAHDEFQAGGWEMERDEYDVGELGIIDTLDEGGSDARRRQNVVGGDLAKLGLVLAEELERAGEDPTNLLTFLHTLTRGGGGLTAATPLWSTLKVQLQRIVLNSGVPSAAHPKQDVRPREVWLAEAMFIVRDHPDWSDAEVARKAKISPSQLSRCDTYRRAAQIAREPKDNHIGPD